MTQVKLFKFGGVFFPPPADRCASICSSNSCARADCTLEPDVFDRDWSSGSSSGISIGCARLPEESLAGPGGRVMPGMGPNGSTKSGMWEEPSCSTSMTMGGEEMWELVRRRLERCSSGTEDSVVDGAAVRRVDRVVGWLEPSVDTWRNPSERGMLWKLIRGLEEVRMWWVMELEVSGTRLLWREEAAGCSIVETKRGGDGDVEDMLKSSS
jgi:hypothetical protein